MREERDWNRARVPHFGTKPNAGHHGGIDRGIAITLLTGLLIGGAAVLALVIFALIRSIHWIGPAEVGLVTRNFSLKKLADDDIVAFNGEAGYQADLLMPGIRFKLWPIFSVSKHPWVQVPAGEIGVIIAQVGAPLPVGAKSAAYNSALGNFSALRDFLVGGGQKGVQRPVLPPGTLSPIHPAAYLLNPFLVRVELVPMLVVTQGEVAVVKGFVGLPTIDTSGEEFKFGSIVAPGHRGIWREPLRTGKYPINPRCYAAEIVPTSIITLNWANATSQAHNLDAHLSPIEGKSREGFVFRIDLQVQIHVPDTRAPKVISMVGTMMNLVNEVLQSAVGNHFRNTLQMLEAIKFIETRHEVQARALTAVTDYLQDYQVETRGVYIQDVEFPEEMVKVLTTREIANQERVTFEEQQRAQVVRVELEKARGTADMQAQLAASQVGIGIKENEASARKAEAEGEAGATVTLGNADAERQRALAMAQADATRAIGDAEASKTRAVGVAEADAMRAQGEAQGNTARVVGMAQADAAKALGLAQAEGYEAQVDALGESATAVVNVVEAIGRGDVKVRPDVLVSGGGGALDGLAAALMRMLQDGSLDRGTRRNGERTGAEPAETSGLGGTAQSTDPPKPPAGKALPPSA